MAKQTLTQAKKAKNDEFYTQLVDIQNEMNAYLDYNPDVFRNKTILLPCDDPEWSNFTLFFAQNFERFGLKKLISTSYAPESKKIKTWQPTLFETGSPQFDADKSKTNGKIFILDRDVNADGLVDHKDIQWEYLQGDGDFDSDEVRKFRDEADIIITNPPFSLFRKFITWIMEANKQFAIIGHQNAIIYKEVFPSIKENKIWLGKGFKGGAGYFISNYTNYATAGNHVKGMIRVSGVIWLTNLEHGRRHEMLSLMKTSDIFKYSKHKELKGQTDFLHYEDYDAIDVRFTDSIPDDYLGVMGVPITFMDKYNPNQFEIINCCEPCISLKNIKNTGVYEEIPSRQKTHNGVLCQKTYHRILIRKK